MRVGHTLGLLAFCSISAFAQSPPQRTFVSTSGLDSNGCTRQSPCRNFAPAVAAVAAGGDVVVLDSGGYGTVTIDKSVALIAPPGVYAAITAFSGNAVMVNAPAGSVVVRGLTLTSMGGQDGIVFGDGLFLRMENVSVSGFPGSGVYAYADGGAFTVRDSAFSENGFGIFMSTVASSLSGSIDHARLERCGLGLSVHGNNKLIVRDSTIFGGGGNFGVRLDPSSAPAYVFLDNCMISQTTLAVSASAGSLGTSTVVLTRTSIVQNGQGLYSSGSTNHIVSLGNNSFHGNTMEGTFTSTLSVK